MGGRRDRAGLELPRRQCGGDYALSRGEYRSDHDGDPALGHRRTLRAAGGVAVEGAMAPQRADLPAVAALGFAFFGVFFVLYNIAMPYTTAARASLALATLPLHTMLVGALLGIEPLTKRKSIGVGVAVLGVFAALATGLSS